MKQEKLDQVKEVHRKLEKIRDSLEDRIEFLVASTNLDTNIMPAVHLLLIESLDNYSTWRSKLTASYWLSELVDHLDSIETEENKDTIQKIRQKFCIKKHQTFSQLIEEDYKDE